MKLTQISLRNTKASLPKTWKLPFVWSITIAKLDEPISKLIQQTKVSMGLEVLTIGPQHTLRLVFWDNATTHTGQKGGANTYKVNMYNSNITIMWTPIFEWKAIRCGFEDGHQKGIMCLKEIGLRAQNMLNILGLSSQHDWGTYMTT